MQGGMMQVPWPAQQQLQQQFQQQQPQQQPMQQRHQQSHSAGQPRPLQKPLAPGPVLPEAQRAAKEKPSLTAGLEWLVGRWTDSLGNGINVFSLDQNELKLVASLSRPRRRDIILNIYQKPEDGTWCCGNAKLVPQLCTRLQLHWRSADGKTSVWERPEEYGDYSEDDPGPW